VSSYVVLGRHVSQRDPTWQETLAEAHARHIRPKCLCVSEGRDMYVAQIGRQFFVKRMPRTGWLHATTCGSFEPRPELSGVASIPESAISEDPDTGMTVVRLDFPMSERALRTTATTRQATADEDASMGRLSLRELLVYLWTRSELTKWHPAFAHRRSWATVRGLLLKAASTTVVSGRRLSTCLFIPEVFNVAAKVDIVARRDQWWARYTRVKSAPTEFMLLIAELKGLTRVGFGGRAVFKHLPYVHFRLNDQLLAQVERRFQPELALWATDDDLHLIVISTVSFLRTGVPELHQLSALVTSPQWLPIATIAELALVRQLVREERLFVKGLRCGGVVEPGVSAAATLTDAGPQPRRGVHRRQPGRRSRGRRGGCKP
jgi:hypothetical protein